MALQSLPQSATEYGNTQRKEILAALSLVQRQWRRMGDNFDASYAVIEPILLDGAFTAQERIAAGALTYIPAVMDEQSLTIPRTPLYESGPKNFVGTAGNGLPVATLFYEAVIKAKAAVGDGWTVPQALDSSGKWLTSATGTMLSDTGRSAEKVAGNARKVKLWTRMLNPPSCGRCVVLAGTTSGSDEAFLRHPKCFPAGVTVSGPALDAASRRWYEGELVTLTTASGENLSLTGNHPVLTRRGWVPANLLKEGDDVFRSTRPKGATALVVPDHNQVPTLIEDVWGAFSVNGLDTVPTTAEDFHGDGQRGEVDIVYADGALRNDMNAALGEHVIEQGLAFGVKLPFGFDMKRIAQLGNGGHAAHPRGPVGGSGLLLPVGGAEGFVPGEPCLTHAAPFDPSITEPFGDHSTGHSILPGEGVFTDPRLVSGDYLSVRDELDPPRWDAPELPFSMESRAGYASRGLDLVDRLTGQVEADRVVQLSRTDFAGHVYSPSSSEGWLSANNLIVSNCDCRNIPSSESIANDTLTDPHAYFESLGPDERVKLMGSQANARAMEDGADLNQIINAYRKSGGVQPAQVNGRSVKFTREGTTRRGYAYSQMSKAQYVKDQGNLRIKAGGSSRTAVRLKAPRMMPETIYEIAKDQADAKRLLTLYGWI